MNNYLIYTLKSATSATLHSRNLATLHQLTTYLTQLVHAFVAMATSFMPLGPRHISGRLRETVEQICTPTFHRRHCRHFSWRPLEILPSALEKLRSPQNRPQGPLKLGYDERRISKEFFQSSHYVQILFFPLCESKLPNEPASTALQTAERMCGLLRLLKHIPFNMKIEN